jgi:hypothetical protein
MVWGAIWKGERSPLIIMDGDPLLKRGGVSHRVYLMALEQWLQYYRPGTFFQQDNARIHTARAVKEWFETHRIWVMDWPAHSPNMNPIEHVWKKLKEILVRKYPNLHLLKDNETDKAIVEAALQDA